MTFPPRPPGLQEWFRYFDPSQFHFIDTDNLKFTNASALISDLANFLGIDFNYTYYAEDHAKMLDVWEGECQSPKRCGSGEEREKVN